MMSRTESQGLGAVSIADSSASMASSYRQNALMNLENLLSQFKEVKVDENGEEMKDDE